jgi:hypothetical protein
MWFVLLLKAFTYDVKELFSLPAEFPVWKFKLAKIQEKLPEIADYSGKR